MEVIEGVDPDVLTHIMTFLNIPDRLECRLACRELRAQCPSPWRLAGDLLEAVNAFDVCQGCDAKLSFAAGPERPADPRFNERRLAALACDYSADDDTPGWAWRGDAEEAALNDDSFARSDPRRTPAYADLMRRVSARSYATLDDWLATGPFTRSPSPEAERLRELLVFSRRAARRLSSHHEAGLSVTLAASVAGDMNYSGWFPADDDSALWHARDSFPCAFSAAIELATLKVATEELLQSRKDPRAMMWFGEDEYHDISGLAHMQMEYTTEVFAPGGELADTDADPCSDKHFAFLLAPTGACEVLAGMFGEAVCSKLLDPMAHLRATWPAWSQVMRASDENYERPPSSTESSSQPDEDSEE
jgi:hypothetical protein